MGRHGSLAVVPLGDDEHVLPGSRGKSRSTPELWKILSKSTPRERHLVIYGTLAQVTRHTSCLTEQGALLKWTVFGSVVQSLLSMLSTVIAGATTRHLFLRDPDVAIRVLTARDCTQRQCLVTRVDVTCARSSCCLETPCQLQNSRQRLCSRPQWSEIVQLKNHVRFHLLFPLSRVSIAIRISHLLRQTVDTDMSEISCHVRPSMSHEAMQDSPNHKSAIVSSLGCQERWPRLRIGTCGQRLRSSECEHSGSSVAPTGLQPSEGSLTRMEVMQGQKYIACTLCLEQLSQCRQLLCSVRSHLTRRHQCHNRHRCSNVQRSRWQRRQVVHDHSSKPRDRTGLPNSGERTCGLSFPGSHTRVERGASSTEFEFFTTGHTCGQPNRC